MNTPSTTVLVEYVGLKDREEDHLYGTGLVWIGKGDVQEVPVANWSRMRKHVDVWRLVNLAPAESPLKGLASAAAPASPAPAATVAQTDATPTPAAPGSDALESKTKEELHAIAKERGVIVHPNAGPSKVIEALRATAEA